MAISGHGELLWLKERQGVRALVQKQAREIKMLRAAKPDAIPASSCCPVCFRDTPHAEDIHEHDARLISVVPPDFLTE